MKVLPPISRRGMRSTRQLSTSHLRRQLDRGAESSSLLTEHVYSWAYCPHSQVTSRCAVLCWGRAEGGYVQSELVSGSLVFFVPQTRITSRSCQDVCEQRCFFWGTGSMWLEISCPAFFLLFGCWLHLTLQTQGKVTTLSGVSPATPHSIALHRKVTWQQELLPQVPGFGAHFASCKESF